MKTARETREILDKLETQHPDADTELHYHDAVRAAGRDDPVGAVDRRARQHGDAGAVQALSRRARAGEGDHRRARAADSLHRVLPREVEVADRHGAGARRTTTAARCRRRWRRSSSCPGVGRKTANVVLGHALGVPGLPVDRHVLRVANRIGIAEGDDPIVVEQQLCGAMPPERWTRTSDTLILHGRRICRPKPLCDQCVVRDDCDYYRLVVSRERSAQGRSRSQSQNRKLKSENRKAVGTKPVRKARR